jgi:hypothetical protein
MKSDEINGIGFDDLTNNTTSNVTSNNKNSSNLNKIGRKLAFFGEKLAESDTNHVVLENENDNLSDDNQENYNNNNNNNNNKHDEPKFKINNLMKKNQSTSKDSSQEEKS